MVNCSQCGLDNEDSYAFCVRCGTSLEKQEEKPLVVPPPEEKECPQCGARLPKIFRFCGSCGYQFVDENNKPPQRGPRASQVTSYDLRQVKGSTGGHRAVVVPPIPKADPVAPTEVSVNARESSGVRFVIINKDGSEGATIPINGPVMKLGRDSPHSALSEDPCLSPVHMVIKERDGELEVSDAGSLNGIFINVPLEPVPLEHGDQLRFGAQLMEFRVIKKEAPAEDESGVRRIGSENVNYWGLLAVVSHPCVDYQVIPIVTDICIVGREKGDIRLPDDKFVSGRHLEIRRVDESYFIRDLNSSNGTYIRIKQPRIMKVNDRVMMGQQLFVLRK